MTMLLSSTFLPKLRILASPLKPIVLTASHTISYSSSTGLPLCSATLSQPNVAELANSARISLSPQEVEEFGPKIKQVIDWFGKLQDVDLGSTEPSLRASTESGSNSREDTPQTFDNREGIIEAIPSYDDPYIKVPKVLSKE